MSLFYTAAYWLGFTPWEHAAAHPTAARHIEALFDREEAERGPAWVRAFIGFRTSEPCTAAPRR